MTITKPFLGSVRRETGNVIDERSLQGGQTKSWRFLTIRPVSPPEWGLEARDYRYLLLALHYDLSVGPRKFN